MCTHNFTLGADSLIASLWLAFLHQGHRQKYWSKVITYLRIVFHYCHRGYCYFEICTNGISSYNITDFEMKERN